MTRARPPFFWGLAGAAALLLAGYVYVAYVIASYGGWSADFGWDAARHQGRWRVSRITPMGPAEGLLQPGDVILALAGREAAAAVGPFFDFTGYDREIRFVRADRAATPYVARVARNGQVHDVSLRPRVGYDPRDVVTTLSLVATSLSFFLVGTFVGLSRPRDQLPRLLAMSSLPSAAILMAIAMQPSNPFLGGWEGLPRLLLVAVYPFHYLLAYSFFFRVVCPASRPRLWTAVERGLWVAGLAVWAMRTTSSLINVPELPAAIALAARHEDAFAWFSNATLMMQRVYNPFLTLSLPAVLAANYRANRDPTHRRRLKWIVYGTLLGLGPLFVEAVVRSALAAAGLAHLSLTAPYQFFYRLTTTAPILVPVAFGYAIARHRVLGVQVVVRRGLQYLLARHVLRLALSLPILGLVYTFAVNADKTIGQVLAERSAVFYGVFFIAAAVSITYRAQLKDWLDRRFFREVYQQEKILLALVEELRACDSVPDISRLVCDRVLLALHPVAVHVLYRARERSEFEVGHSSSGAGIVVPEHFTTIDLLQHRSRALELPPEGSSALPIAEEQWFRALGVTMLIGMKGADGRLCGLLLLGDKRSEEAYSPNDHELLQAIAGQAAIVWENLWLKEGIRREHQIRRDVLAHVDSRALNLVRECPQCGRCFDRVEEQCAADGTALQLTLPIERTLDGRYRLERRLGRGAMGVVYEAFDQRLRRPVAVKVLHGVLFGAGDALRRFEREAQISSRLAHAHVVRMYDYGGIGTDGAYLVMELLHGSTWRDELNRAGVIAPETLATRLDQVLDGLDAAHRLGLIHRDLKPENLMICAAADGSTQAKILDFGLAKELFVDADTRTTVAALTAPGMLLGTYSYMSPEQLSAAPVDARSDLFAVAVIAVESLTGRRPFRGRTLADLVRAVLHESFHLGGDGDNVRALEACLQQALAKAPTERYPSAAALRADLIPAIRQCSTTGSLPFQSLRSESEP
jgi:hypothetical protein